jgi:hypothetical protein
MTERFNKLYETLLEDVSPDSKKLERVLGTSKFRARDGGTIGPDSVIDVDGDVKIEQYAKEAIKDGKFIYKLGHVGGNFWFINSDLTSLEGCPSTVGGDYVVVGNKLTSLKGAPEKVPGTFQCKYNKLTSFEGFPKEVAKNVYCYQAMGDKEIKEEDIKKVCKVGGKIYTTQN